jgi:hypothetical protein
MKILKVSVITATMLAVALPPYFSGQNESRRQPFPEMGFWVTETHPNEQTTVVKYYANSNYFVSQSVETEQLDISKLSVRKYLNKKLREELAKDSTIKTLPKLYEIN